MDEIDKKIFYEDSYNEKARETIKNLLLLLFEYIFHIESGDDPKYSVDIISDINEKYMTICSDDLTDEQLMSMYITMISSFEAIDKSILYKLLTLPCHFLRDKDGTPYIEYGIDDIINDDLDDDDIDDDNYEYN